MMSDLFTIFDYGWGAGFTFLSLPVWFSGLLVPFFVMSYMVYWYAPNLLESVLMDWVKTFGAKMPEEVKWMGGTPHVFVTLLLMLLTFNISGALPYQYALSSHFFVTGSFAFVFWFGTVFLNMSPNWRLLFVGMVHEGGYLVPNAMVIFSEVVSFLARPVTLMCRLSMNIIIGQIIMSLIGGVCVGIFFPFFWYTNNLGGMMFESSGEFIGTLYSSIILPVISYFMYVLRHLMILSIHSFMFLVEMGVAILQACIFTGLLVFYVYEVPLKLQEDSVA